MSQVIQKLTYNVVMQPVNSLVGFPSELEIGSITATERRIARFLILRVASGLSK